jgi:hypothetical protein
MVPRQGPMKGSQYLTITIAGFNLYISLPTENQFNGFTEFMTTLISISGGAGSLENCVVPGNKNPGYCNENV